MAEHITVYRVFISSPSDVQAERSIALQAIQRINESCEETLGATLIGKSWQHQPPVAPVPSEETIQDQINKEVENAQFFVLILHKRYGSIEPGHTKSNTEREVDLILKRYETNPEIRILAYFKDIDSNTDRGPQEEQVLDFKKRLDAIPIRYATFKRPADFKDAITHDIYRVVMRLRLSPYKRDALRRFWRIGTASKTVAPNVAIIFPAVNRKFSGPADESLWLQRLEPNVYYEDLRSIHKIQKTLSVVGLHGYKTYTTNNMPADRVYMNVIWVCFPRSWDAMQRLNALYSRTRFKFQYRQEVASTVEWINTKGAKIQISSPLATYIRLQRTGMDIGGECTARLRSIVCKDYAIISRFRNEDSAELCNTGHLYEYFIAGIRGLGTWGAAWFLDRRYKRLLGQSREEDLQLLLEVKYENGSICDVIEVSDRSAEYFDQQNDVDFIRNEINMFVNR